MLADGSQDGATGFGGELFGGEDTFDVGGKIFYKLSGDVSGGIGYGCIVAALLANLVERGEKRVRADEEVLILFGTTLEAANEHRGGETGVVKHAATNEDSDLARGKGLGEPTKDQAGRAIQAALFVPAAEAVEFVAADLDVEIVHGNEAGKRGDFILRGEDHVGLADGIGEAEFFEFGKALGEVEFLVAVDTGMGDGLIEGNFRGPLGNGVFAFAALVKANVNGMDLVEQFGGTFDEEIG